MKQVGVHKLIDVSEHHWHLRYRGELLVALFPQHALEVELEGLCGVGAEIEADFQAGGVQANCGKVAVATHTLEINTQVAAAYSLFKNQSGRGCGGPTFDASLLRAVARAREREAGSTSTCL